jgi:hypothetical protein
MTRADLSHHLVHWVRGESDEAAFHVLRAIVRERRLLGGGGHIKGGFTCLCFTEAPQMSFHQISGRYRPFGVRVSKGWLFAKGGRPVIYQDDNEFEQLPNTHKWRHVRYEPHRQPPFDFSWEREWRIRKDELALPSDEVIVLVPSASWIDDLIEEHKTLEHERAELDVLEHDDASLWSQPRAPFPYGWEILDLKQGWR